MSRLFPHVDLEQLKKQAKDLLAACHAGDATALRRLAAHGPGIQVSGPTERTEAAAVRLAHTQFVVAREQGFPSWPKLKAHGAAAAQQTERDLDEATRVVVPAGTETRTEFARTRATAAGMLAKRRDVERLALCLTSMALRDLLAVRALLWESGDFRLVVDTLILGLEHSRAATRYRCAEALDHLGDERCFEPLKRLVMDAVPRVRRMALHSLGCDTCKFMPLPRDCDVLALIIDRALNDPSINVRRAAASALGQYRHDSRAVEALGLLADQERDRAILRSVHRTLRT